MKTMSGWSGALLAGVMLVALAPTAAGSAERPGFETYVVRHGDTLSAISGRVFGDPKRWREIQKQNPQVTNPNRIYPGDSLFVPVPQTAASVAAPEGGLEAKEGVDAAATQAAADAAAAAEAAAAAAAAKSAAEIAAAANAVPELPVVPMSRPAMVSAGTYRNAGYIADGLPTMAIVASLDERIMLASGDVAIANSAVPAGRRFNVVRADRRIFHPRTGQPLGWLMRVLGEAECTCRGEETATVALQRMRDAAGVGDYLVPVDANDVLEENVLPGRARPECVTAGPADGVIVAFDEERSIVGEQEYAYIDRGAAAGTAPGKRYLIYREVAPEGRVMVGELQVLRAGRQTASTLITSSVQEVQVGDLLRAR